ncbi:SpoVR family protein [Klebsiella pneumoniae subsp. pneumoniae]|nr:SpoVR family protein [Klebsiella pneumoniae subsp. pneumoniae]
MFARKYITECEERYGVDEVEKLLDSCHALMNYGVDRYKRPQKSLCRRRESAAEKPGRVSAKPVNMLWRTLPKREGRKSD